MSRVLVVDDESSMRRVIGLILKQDGHEIAEAAGVVDAREALASSRFDVVLCDQKMKDGDGKQVLASVMDADPELPVVMITAHATVELAVEVMRLGAFDFISKPFEAEAVRMVVSRACERTALRRESHLLKEQVRRLTPDRTLLGKSAAIERVKDYIDRVAKTNATVLITGETGTGKELVARALHEASGGTRGAGPFVAVNCAGLVDTLLESELFGHEKGAYTGADRARAGLFEAADGGTLFLDEAGEMSLPLQAKLLRVLTDGNVQRVGSRTAKKVDVRLIVATHRDLKKRVAEGTFREDLYYRVAVVPIEVPPLRERLEDLPVLVEHFLTTVARELKRPALVASPMALAKLKEYHFPGNVRELRNLIERAVILARGTQIEAEDFPVEIADGANGGFGGTGSGGVPGSRDSISGLPLSIDMRNYLEEIEQKLILRALENSGGVQAEAARKLNVSRSDLAYKLKKYEIQPLSAQARE
jgi:DNA-binding NtrC family response regulator